MIPAMKKFINEFKTFIARGNVMDMAVGVIIGGAFKAIADSLTADIIMPILGIFTSEVSFADLSVTVGGAVITYGNFINAILNFLIMALVVFTMIKAINTFHDKAAAMAKKKEEEAPAAPPEPSAQEKLLMEIRRPAEGAEQVSRRHGKEALWPTPIKSDPTPTSSLTTGRSSRSISPPPR